MRRHFIRHYLEMLVAMSVGMLVLGAARAGVLAIAGIEHWATRHPEFAALAMAFDMSVGMLAWMRYRGHAWPATLEMVGAMVAPAVVLAPLGWLDVISGDQLMIATHVVMLPLMLIVMLRRVDEYAR
jgi:hypothetical protein